MNTIYKVSPFAAFCEFGLYKWHYYYYYYYYYKVSCRREAVELCLLLKTLNCSLEVTQFHQKWHHSIGHIRLAISRPL